jgi:hypothetical protein
VALSLQRPGLEETARLMLLARTEPDALSEDQIDAPRRTFGARW